MGRNLVEGDSHRLVLVEAVPFTEAVDHARANLPANSGLDDVVLRLARTSCLSPNGLEHLVVEPYGRSDLGHLTSVAASGALGSPSRLQGPTRRSPSDSTKSSRRTPRAGLDSRNGERIAATILAGVTWRVLVTDAPNPTSTGSPKPTALLAHELFRWVEAGPPATNPRTVAGVEVFEDRLPSGFVATYFVGEREPYLAVLRARRL